MLEKGCRSVDTGCGVTSDLNESAITIATLAAASVTPVDTLWKEREWT